MVWLYNNTGKSAFGAILYHDPTSPARAPPTWRRKSATLIICTPAKVLSLSRWLSRQKIVGFPLDRAFEDAVVGRVVLYRIESLRGRHSLREILDSCLRRRNGLFRPAEVMESSRNPVVWLN